MSFLSLHTPLGSLTVFEHSGSLVALEWGEAGRVDTDPATPQDITPLLAAVREGLRRYFDGEPLPVDWPLAPNGTPFQLRVWERLRQQPFGTTVTYGELARSLLSSPRAVAGACARNPLPIIVPCHRVVAQGGHLGGYSGGDGPSTKAMLLRIEGVSIADSG